MNRWLSAALVFLSIPSLAAAEDDPKLAALLAAGPDALLAEADSRLTLWKDEVMKVRLTSIGGADAGRVVQMVMTTKGSALRNMRFEEPADTRGMGVVIKGTDEIYVRLPDSTNVRRVASHARKQTLQGTEVAFDDSSLIRLSPQFSAALTSQTEKYVELTLTRKPDGKVGPATRAAIRHYEQIAALPVTGEPSLELLTHLRQITALMTEPNR